MTVRASALPPVCILAGGVGSRLGEAVGQVPKPMLPVAGRPFLFHQLELLAREGADEVVLCIGYLGDVIRHAVGDGSAFGLRVAYSDDGGDRSGRPERSGRRSPGSASGSWCCTATLICGSTTQTSTGGPGVRPAGLDDRAAQRGALGRQQRAGGRRPGRAL